MTDKTRLQENYLSGLEKALPAALKEIDEIMDVYVTHHILTKDVPAIIVEARAQAAEIAKLELDLLQAGRLEHELSAIITAKDAEIEKIAVVLENETGLLNDDTLTSERLEEILRAMKHQAEHASELIKEQAAEIERLEKQAVHHNMDMDAKQINTENLAEENESLRREIERLTAALEFYANQNNWEPRVATPSDAVLDSGDIARAARESTVGALAMDLDDIRESSNVKREATNE